MTIDPQRNDDGNHAVPDAEEVEATARRFNGSLEAGTNVYKQVDEDGDTVLTVNDVAQRLQVSEQTVCSLLLGGEMKGRKFGHEWLVTGRELSNFIESCTVGD